VDSSRNNGVGTVSNMTVEEAARNLVVKEVSVRMSVGRGKMRSRK
jgi:hypothetical protein